MSLARVTPVILTLNEAPNLARTLANLAWAERIVVVDSFSDDATCEIARADPRVALFQRRFDTHAQQWNYAIAETAVATPWILALDADYQVTPQAAREIERRLDEVGVAAFRARFRYCVAGRALRGAAYPPVTVLFRAGAGRYEQDGHTQRLAVQGVIADLEQPLLHDDRKPLSAWLAAQVRYARLEAEKLAAAPFAALGPADKLRRTLVLAAPAMLLYCLFVKGNVLDGRAGLFYAGQRTLVEIMLALFLIERGFSSA
jgi:glycosyltransferase involved in cell wall biosynthesis